MSSTARLDHDHDPEQDRAGHPAPPTRPTPLAPPSDGSGRHLLVVDWTYFFPNPMDNLDTDNLEFWLYDWVRGEQPPLLDWIWYERAVGFLRFGLPLPMCQGYDGFWERFRFAPGTELVLADSNKHAAHLAPRGDRNTSVWHYDAHHDAHPDHGHGQYLHGSRMRTSMTAGNWMTSHGDRGSELHLRYPPWRTRWEQTDPGPVLPLDRALDDGTCPPVTFDTAFLCRSGGAVPSWCDQQFAELVAAFPGNTYQIDDTPLDRRFDLAAAQRDAVDRTAQFALLHELIEQRGQHQQQGDQAGQNDPGDLGDLGDGKRSDGR